MKTLSPPLRGQYPASEVECQQAEAAILALDTIVDPVWLAQRITTLLSHYYVADIHPAALQAIAKDWTNELKTYPEWAIDAACSWWLSRHNPKRRNKPMPGDISERAQIETSILTAAKAQIGFYRKYGDNPPTFIARTKL